VVYPHDLIPLPVDEWATDAETSPAWPCVPIHCGGKLLDIDAVTFRAS
jgi:hypothetical protein